MKKITKAQLFHFDFEVFSVEIKDSFFSCAKDDSGIFFESWVSGNCVILNGDLEIKFDWLAKGGEDTYKSAHDFKLELHKNFPAIQLKNFILVDDNGKKLNQYDSNHIILDFLENVNWKPSVFVALPKAKVNDLSAGKPKKRLKEYIINDSLFNEYIVERDNGPDIKFIGQIIAEVDDTLKLRLYKTKCEKYICEQIDQNKNKKSKICDNADQVFDFFGNGYLAKKLYKKAGTKNLIKNKKITKKKGFVLVDDQLYDLDEDDCNYILTGFLIGGKWTHDVSLFLKKKLKI